ncbi:(2Fe-2S)-binding protein [Pontibacter sp. JAM-7]|uniref:(2Fe-2S)-binding protein n=1 Tax=Pontibacter sp. JAM-7 TaxID=3366581 RepID=UPI003AF9C8B7
MYICICNNVTDSQVKEAVDQGARSLRDLNQSLDVAGTCGKCACAARSVMQQHISEQDFELAVPA